MLLKQEAALTEARAEFSKEKDALQAQLEQLEQDTLKLAELQEENEMLNRQFGEQRDHIVQLIRDDEFKESLFDMLRDVDRSQVSTSACSIFGSQNLLRLMVQSVFVI